MLFTCSKYPRYRVLVSGRYLEFKNNQFKTEDLDEIAALKAIPDISFEDVEEVDKKPKK